MRTIKWSSESRPRPNRLPSGTEANQNGMLLTNTATVTATGVGPLADTAQVEVVEPDLNITKDAAPLVVDGGDTVTFTMTVNHTAASTADAFDVAITDVLPAGLTYAGNVIPITGAARGLGRGPDGDVLLGGYSSGRRPVHVHL